jgi:hypothetical protein
MHKKSILQRDNLAKNTIHSEIMGFCSFPKMKQEKTGMKFLFLKPLGRQAPYFPDTMASLVKETIVQAVMPALPEFYGLRQDAKSPPKVGFGYGPFPEAILQFHVTIGQKFP